MNNYSYSEIQSMQKKAMERVREMQKNSDAIVELAQQNFDTTHKTFNAEENIKSTVIKPKITNMPPNFPEEKVFPDFDEYFRTTQKESMGEDTSIEKHSAKKDNNLLENILSDPDRLLILGLLLLLKSEGNDEMLMMALMYIMS